ncbi:peptidase M56, partial [Listeria monocytogenes]|nr:peptidase M56 [Listeria monocytogenes]
QNKKHNILFSISMIVLCIVGVLFSAFQADVFTLEKKRGITIERRK